MTGMANLGCRMISVRRTFSHAPESRKCPAVMISRREFASTTAVATGVLLTGCAGLKAGGGGILDTHTHFYDPTRESGVPWPAKTDALLHRTVLPKHYRSLRVPQRVDGTVVVEASPLVEDNQWILDLAADDPGDIDLYLALAERTGDPVLELAAGSGRIAVPLAAAGHRVTAVDIDPAMLARARASAERERVAARLEPVEADLLGVRLGHLVERDRAVGGFVHARRE